MPDTQTDPQTQQQKSAADQPQALIDPAFYEQMSGTSTNSADQGVQALMRSHFQLIDSTVANFKEVANLWSLNLIRQEIVRQVSQQVTAQVVQQFRSNPALISQIVQQAVPQIKQQLQTSR